MVGRNGSKAGSDGVLIPPKGERAVTLAQLQTVFMQLWERQAEIEKRTRRSRIVEIVRSEYGKEAARLEKLRDDCVRVLNLLKSKGIVTQAEINEAIGGD